MVGWAASLQNPYRRGGPLISEDGSLIESGLAPDNEYYWFYLVIFGFVGAVVFLISWPLKKPLFFRWAIAAALCIWLVYLFFITGMHSPPAHFHSLFAALIAATLCIFMCGYALGLKKQNATRPENDTLDLDAEKTRARS